MIVNNASTDYTTTYIDKCQDCLFPCCPLYILLAKAINNLMSYNIVQELSKTHSITIWAEFSIGCISQTAASTRYYIITWQLISTKSAREFTNTASYVMYTWHGKLTAKLKSRNDIPRMICPDLLREISTNLQHLSALLGMPWKEELLLSA